jgi:hypothetical protein
MVLHTPAMSTQDEENPLDMFQSKITDTDEMTICHDSDEIRCYLNKRN